MLGYRGVSILQKLLLKDKFEHFAHGLVNYDSYTSTKLTVVSLLYGIRSLETVSISVQSHLQVHR